jgi:hypothetical protein
VTSSTDSHYITVPLTQGVVGGNWERNVYTKTGANTATINSVDGGVGQNLVGQLTLTSATGGTLVQCSGYPNIYQTGTFSFASGSAPATLRGMSFSMGVLMESPLLETTDSTKSFLIPKLTLTGWLMCS